MATDRRRWPLQIQLQWRQLLRRTFRPCASPERNGGWVHGRTRTGGSSGERVGCNDNPGTHITTAGPQITGGGWPVSAQCHSSVVRLPERADFYAAIARVRGEGFDKYARHGVCQKRPALRSERSAEDRLPTYEGSDSRARVGPTTIARCTGCGRNPRGPKCLPRGKRSTNHNCSGGSSVTSDQYT